MKKSIVVLLFLLILIPFVSQAGVNFIMDFKPASLLFSPDLDGFTVDGESSGWVLYRQDRVEGIGSFLPKMNLGLGISVPVIYIDITGGAGYLYNGGVSSPVFSTNLALRFKLGRFVTLGPHIGFLFLNPKWSGELSDSDDVKLSKDTGFNPGLCFTVGHPIVGFSMSIDYVAATFDVETFNGWTAPDQLEMSGISLNLGLYVRL